MYKANNSRLVNGEIWICYIRNQNILKNIQRCFIANFHNFSIDIIHYKIFTYINSRITIIIIAMTTTRLSIKPKDIISVSVTVITPINNVVIF